ncbi:PREDICTED: protein eyes shut homolog [Amphimedon queenslandica]|uniref:EGF-like domain-containing protein n=1 Tax=Amphimedon queenslandica TaxID=400682 RepID=A0AAN0JP87_AMPQE|nr:PREDICTED: protein eyes shut homolog [Amphimedon queenslandica]|eukprot:XP_019858829.1 PREDICTED: protein eyes shut homolog [Amphimedon queenslandica]
MVWFKFVLVPSGLLLLLSCSCLIDAQYCDGGMFYNCTTGECESLGVGYVFQLDRTCYNITYKTSNSTVTPGTYLFSFTIFIEEGTTGTIAGFRETQIIIFSGPSESAFSTVLYPPTSNITKEINAGRAIDDDEELTYGSYSTTIRMVLVPPFRLVVYPVNIEIVDPCADINCNPNGACSNGVCVCHPGFTGPDCNTAYEFDPCYSSPCANGNCTYIPPNLFTCSCEPGYTGDTCNAEIDHCEGADCGNGACINTPAIGYTCECQSGYTGDHCSININDCHPNPCVNGICTDAVAGYTCSCFYDWTGTDCDIEISSCCPNPCMSKNYMYCIDGNGTHTCVCHPGYTDASCSTDIDECDPNPCHNNGTCTDRINGYDCSCPSGYYGHNCSDIFDACSPNPCHNGGNCSIVDLNNSTCTCPVGFTGDTCENVTCEDGTSCFNDGICTVINNTINCSCPPGYSGLKCESDINVCSPISPCPNECTCLDGPGLNYTCSCPVGLCYLNPCQNEGQCIPDNKSSSYTCNCAENFSGSDCNETLPNNMSCSSDDDCPSSTYCYYQCSSDDYPKHSSLITEPVDLSGNSFINVQQSKFPSFNDDFSLYAVFSQNASNRGYLFFYGTSGISRNFAIFLDHNSSKLWFYYTDMSGVSRNFSLSFSWSSNEVHQLVLTYNQATKITNFFFDGLLLADGVQTLVNPNFSYGFASTSPKVFIGARLPHYFHFIGAIHQVVFFKEALNSTFISQLMDDYDTLVNLSGVCTNYLQIGATCPAPSAAPSALCQSSISKCNPNARCLPDVDYRYTCQPQPVVCTSDSTCQPNYYCSSGTIPNDNSNYYQNSDKSLPGQSVFLQENLMHFSEESITRTNVLPVHKVPDLVSDLTIFAIVTQEPGNDGYVIGKGLNDKMRDFGLYLRSSKSTIWVAYGSDDKGVGFHDIVFFYDVNVADGNEHSVTAVIDGSASSASLYIDGVLRGYQCPLPVKPAFRPDYNILYVGGRPGTKRFQFKGSIRNLFIGSGAFQYDNVKQLHDDAFDGDSSLSLETTDTQYCLPYISSNERCIVGNNNDFR